MHHNGVAVDAHYSANLLLTHARLERTCMHTDRIATAASNFSAGRNRLQIYTALARQNT